MAKLSGTQKVLLEIYKEFKEFCETNHIKFYAVAGTALGAVRHQGFIPWDDDIDIGMPIKDFLRFKKIIKTKKLPNHLDFIESYWMGGKIYNKTTTIIDIRHINHTNYYHGVYIDIFPLIGLPNSKPERQKFIDEIKSFEKTAELFEYYPEISPFTKTQILDWKNYLQSAYDYEKSEKLAALCYFQCDGAGFKNPIKMKFEDTDIPVSSNYDLDLTNHFGNYMELPKKTDRKTHDEYHIFDLEKPCQQYISLYQKIPVQFQELITKKQLVEGKLTQYCNSLSYELVKKDDKIQKLKSKIDSIYSSKEYKIGNILLKPIRFVISKIRIKK